MTNVWRCSIRTALLFFLGLSVTGLANAQQTVTGAPLKPQVFREDIEWLDIWMPDSKVTNQPRVLMIGDSITRAYNQQVEAALKGKAVVFRLATSKCAGDPVLSEEISLVLGHTSSMSFTLTTAFTARNTATRHTATACGT